MNSTCLNYMEKCCCRKTVLSISQSKLLLLPLVGHYELLELNGSTQTNVGRYKLTELCGNFLEQPIWIHKGKVR